MRKLGASLVFLATVLGALVPWPTGCSPAGAPVVKQSAPGAASSGPLALGPKGPVTFLGHPAFAYAQSTGKAVSIAEVAEKALPSVVSISTTRLAKARPMPFSDDPAFRQFFGRGTPPKKFREHGLGSGVVVSGDGLVLTNNHVVENADDLEVTASDGRVFRAKVVGTDPHSDLALLRVEGDTKGLRAIELDDSERLRLGDVVLAIGNPFGVGQTVTMGIVSAKGRANVGIVDYEDFIQTDAAINPGNSGGALVDMDGKLVGINTAILSRTGGSNGIGFAIPSDMVRPIMQALLDHGKVVRGWLGIGIQDVSQDLQKALGLPTADGVLVSDVEAGGPADRAGLKHGDVILKIAGRVTDSTGHLRNIVASSGAGKAVDVEILREGKPKALSVTLGELPARGEDDERRAPSAAPSGGDRLDGLELEPLGERTRHRFRIPDSIRSGVVVTEVDPGSQAAEAGLRQGDVVVEANREKVTGVRELEKTARQSKDKLLLLVQRGGRTRYVVLDR